MWQWKRIGIAIITLIKNKDRFSEMLTMPSRSFASLQPMQTCSPSMLFNSINIACAWPLYLLFVMADVFVLSLETNEMLVRFETEVWQWMLFQKSFHVD